MSDHPSLDNTMYMRCKYHSCDFSTAIDRVCSRVGQPGGWNEDMAWRGSEPPGTWSSSDSLPSHDSFKRVDKAQFYEVQSRYRSDKNKTKARDDGILREDFVSLGLGWSWRRAWGRWPGNFGVRSKRPEVIEFITYSSWFCAIIWQICYHISSVWLLVCLLAAILSIVNYFYNVHALRPALLDNILLMPGHRQSRSCCKIARCFITSTNH
jgi:hypothetical protein